MLFTLVILCYFSLVDIRGIYENILSLTHTKKACYYSENTDSLKFRYKGIFNISRSQGLSCELETVITWMQAAYIIFTIIF